jgi:hypothetical protein
VRFVSNDRMVCVSKLILQQKSRAGLLPEKHTSKKLEDNSSKQKGNQIYRATLIKKSKAAKALALSKHDS